MTPSAKGSEHHNSTLLVDAITLMYKEVGPSEGTHKAADLSSKHGFSYHGLLGELVYSYITCHPNIGYTITTLSKFSMCPHDTHYTLLKKGAKYLHQTKSWGISYQKPSPNSSLPANPQECLPVLADLPPFLSMDNPGVLHGFVNASHTNDLHDHHSTTGYTFVLFLWCHLLLL
jgi:hypothetical protein